MAIAEAKFDSEDELQRWAFDNIASFLPGACLIDGFQITTTSGKNGVPDGFAFSFHDRDWYVVECELLQHGVWPHIAEQITRFVVAVQNPDTLRKIRDRLFEHILAQEMAEDVSRTLETSTERLHQQLELFIEGVQPRIAIFIDETNRDLQDMAHALDIPTSIFRIQKFIVDGKPEYYSPDKQAPVIESEPTERGPASDYDIIELMGGGKLAETAGRFKCYAMSDGSVVHIKRSKLHSREQYYWYGITTAALGHIEEFKVTHIVFAMGEFGFAKVPMETIREYLSHTGTSKNPDGSVRHYHCLISHDPEPELYWSKEQPKYSLTEYFQPFD